MATPEDIQTSAAALADALVTDVANAVQELKNYSYDTASIFPSGLPDVSLGLIDTSGGLSSTVTTITLPTLLTYNDQTSPSSPTLASVSTPSAVQVPTFDDVAPSLNMPTAPSSSLPAAPGTAPEFATPAIPDRPSISLPDVPTFAAVAIPSAPALDMPQFTATLPADDLTEPTTTFNFSESDYSSSLLTAVKQKVSDDLANGGYGIDATDELALWERAKVRELNNADAAIEDVAVQAASRGFILPPGAMLAAQQQAEQTAVNNAAQLSREIALKRADMYVQARQFAIQQGASIEQMLIQYVGAKAERALNAAKATVEAGVSLYQMRVEKLRALLGSYATQAQVYETKIRAQLAALETFKAQLEGARLSADVQRIVVDVYRSQVEAANLSINLYRTDMDAARIKAEVETLKLQGFRTSVEAYSSQVQAREAEFKMFTAQIQGELAKVEVYKAAASAYSAKVDGIRTKAQADETIVRAQVSANQLLLDKLKAETDLYRTNLDKITQANRSTIASSGLFVELEKVLDSKEQTRRQTLTDIQRANASIVADATRISLEKARVQLEAFLKLQEMGLAGVRDGVSAQVRVAEAALNQLSAVATQAA